MKLSTKSLDVLREMINEKTAYRKGAELVDLFNKYGFNDFYGQGFPSRKKYTDDKLQSINGTSKLDDIIKEVFSPSLFIEKYDELGKLINEFNDYIAYDGLCLTLDGINIKISQKDSKFLEERIKRGCNLNSKSDTEDEDFLKVEYSDVNVENLPIPETVKPIISLRIEEMKKAFNSKAYLSCVILCGSVLEGVLLGLAQSYPKDFNCSESAPKRKGSVLLFQDWKLAELIDVAYSLNFFREDVKKYSQILRDFRNYIHPYQQMSSNFYPDEHTSKICMQVLKAGLCQIQERKSIVDNGKE